MNILIIDYGMGNIGSVSHSFELLGATTIISNNPSSLEEASGIILPGVGAFRDGINNLKQQGWVEPLRDAVQIKKIPLLGICLGMQLLANTSTEDGLHQGLGLIPGHVIKLNPHNNQERIPHVGWNEIENIESTPLLKHIPSRTDFYFVHSYHFQPDHEKHIVSCTHYCGTFVSSVASNNIFGTQFHPEKSSYPGRQILKNFLDICQEASCSK